MNYKDLQGFWESRISNVTGKILNVNDTPTGDFTLDGSAVEDQILSPNISQVNDQDGLGNFNYSWQISADNKVWSIKKGENTSQLVLGDEEVGFYFRSVGEYTDQRHFETIYSQLKVRLQGYDKATGQIVISGLFVTGQTLSVDASSIKDIDGLSDFTYNWYRSDNINSGWFTNSSQNIYTIAKTDTSKYLKAEVSYTDKQGFVEKFSGLSKSSWYN